MLIDENKIQEFIDKGLQIIDYATSHDEFIPTGAFHAWQTQVVVYLKNNLSESNHYLIAFQENTASSGSTFYGRKLSAGIGILNSLKEDIEAGTFQESEKLSNINHIENLNTIFNNFHKVVRQLRDRYDDRQTLDIDDEYDVQDLLHSLLRLYFDDIRPEEWTPSYAGKNARMDFLLKDHNIVIEVKKTRRGLGAKEVGTQLIEDIARYKEHPDCETLMCFVYDPEGFITNPKGIENDLHQEEKPLVNVIIRPQH